MIHCIILASGLSKRMGCDKLLLDLGGKPLLGWVIETAQKAGFSVVKLVYGTSEIKAVADGYGIEVIENKEAHLGQSRAIVKAVETDPFADGYLFLNGDQPYIKPQSLQRIAGALRFEEEMMISAAWKGQRTAPVAFSARMRPYLLQVQGDSGGRQLIKSGRFKVELCELDDVSETWDADSPEDYEHILQWLSFYKGQR